MKHSGKIAATVGLILGATLGLNSGAFAAETSRTMVNHTAVTNVDKTGDVGVGIQWGALSGIEAKYWMTELSALSAGAAFQDGNTALNLDYLFHFRDGVFGRSETSRTFVPYIGAGLITAFGKNTNFFNRNTDNFALAARIPIGVEFLPRTIPLGFYGELAPSLGITPSNYTFLTADIGARYYF